MSDVPGASVEAPIKVFLLDDHEVVRRGLRDLLDAEADLTVVGEAATADQALARGPALRPDVAVLDVRLPEPVCLLMRSLRAPEGAKEPEDTRLAALSERERAVLGLIGDGLTKRQIAKLLFLTEKTVKNHISRLPGRPGVERRVRAAVIAAQVHDQGHDGGAAPRHRPAGPEPTRREPGGLFR
ncbi:response regulator transcription factor [Streptomyces erythrochromogenes]|uniref:response regulator transcription factor n=1 Tax=Streptomyces erythrochromogenes TaxID=285574 RepID=UPI003806125D